MKCAPVFDATQCVAAGALRGLPDVRIPLLIGVVGYWLLGLPVAAALAFATPLGPIGPWCGLALGLLLIAAMLATRLRRQMGTLSTRLAAAMSSLGALAIEYAMTARRPRTRYVVGGDVRLLLLLNLLPDTWRDRRGLTRMPPIRAQSRPARGVSMYKTLPIYGLYVICHATRRPRRSNIVNQPQLE